jgi:hypothetical protein
VERPCRGWRAGENRDRDKDRALRVVDWFVTATSDRHYEILDRQLFDAGFVQQHILQRQVDPFTGVHRD